MVREITTLSAQLRRNTARERLLLGLSSGFGSLAVLLAGVGVYGTLAYAVRRRTREIGIRLAFGAHRHAVLSMILSDALKLVTLGIGVGVPIAVAGGYSLRAFLFGVAPVDPARSPPPAPCSHSPRCWPPVFRHAARLPSIPSSRSAGSNHASAVPQRDHRVDP